MSWAVRLTNITLNHRITDAKWLEFLETTNFMSKTWDPSVVPSCQQGVIRVLLEHRTYAVSP